MTATETVIERLRHQVEHRSGQTEFYAIDYGELDALLTVAETVETILMLRSSVDGHPLVFNIQVRQMLEVALTALDSSTGVAV